MIEAALRRRPDVQAAFARLSADRHNVERAESDFLPRVALNGAVSKTVGDVSVHDPLFNVTTSGPVNAPSADVLLSLTMPIYDGGLRDAQLRVANAQASAAEHELTQIENVGARQIVVAYDTLRTSLAAYAAASELTSRRADYCRCGARILFAWAYDAHRRDYGSDGPLGGAPRQGQGAQRCAHRRRNPRLHHGNAGQQGDAGEIGGSRNCSAIGVAEVAALSFSPRPPYRDNKKLAIAKVRVVEQAAGVGSKLAPKLSVLSAQIALGGQGGPARQEAFDERAHRSRRRRPALDQPAFAGNLSEAGLPKSASRATNRPTAPERRRSPARGGPPTDGLRSRRPSGACR